MENLNQYLMELDAILDLSSAENYEEDLLTVLNGSLDEEGKEKTEDERKIARDNIIGLILDKIKESSIIGTIDGKAYEKINYLGEKYNAENNEENFNQLIEEFAKSLSLSVEKNSLLSMLTEVKRIAGEINAKTVLKLIEKLDDKESINNGKKELIKCIEKLNETVALRIKSSNKGKMSKELNDIIKATTHKCQVITSYIEDAVGSEFIEITNEVKEYLSELVELNNKYVKEEAKNEPAGLMYSLKRYAVPIAVTTGVALAISGIAIISSNSNKDKGQKDNNSSKTEISNITDTTKPNNSSIDNTKTNIDTTDGKNNSTNNNETVNSDELSIDDQITAGAHLTYLNWKELGFEYSEDYVVAIAKVINGLESDVDVYSENGEVEATINLDNAKEIIQEMIFKAVGPATVNIYAGVKDNAPKTIKICDLIIGTNEDKAALRKMEDYINSTIIDPDHLSSYAEKALNEEVQIAALGKTVDGLNIIDSNPGLRIAWAELVIGGNYMFGTLGEDYQITIDDETITLAEITNATVYENIIRIAARDLRGNVK